MTTDLAPCPFCGREAEQDFQQAYRAMQTGRIDHGAAVYCTGCNANMIMCRGDHPELSDEERMAIIVDDWNRRTPPPSTHVGVNQTVQRLCDLHENLLRTLEEKVGFKMFSANEVSEVASLVLDAATELDKASRRPPAPSQHVAPQCCMCGKKNLSTVEGDGGTECELEDGRWGCSAECWDRAVETAPSQHVVGILQRIADEISALKLHPATGQEYDAGYIGGRGDAFAIVQEAIENLPPEPKPGDLGLSVKEQKAQAERCGCHGTDDYCPCQNSPDSATLRLRAAAQAAVDTGGLPVKVERELRAALATTEGSAV